MSDTKHQNRQKTGDEILDPVHGSVWENVWKSVMQRPVVQTLLQLAYDEDLAAGDITSSSIFTSPKQVTAQVVARSPTIVCGLPLVQKFCYLVDPNLALKIVTKEGELVQENTTIATITGDIQSVLMAERPVLNFLMRLCGVANNAHAAVDHIPKHCRAGIYDTRKTTPGWRYLEKAAVLIGGGCNHRFALHDAVLIKDNHIAAAGSLSAAIDACREKVHKQLKQIVIEVEIDHLHQLDEALSAKPDIILLDNFTLPNLHKAVNKTAGRALLEASGGVTLATLSAIAETGVDRISMGALTHTVIPADIALDMQS